MKISIVTPAYNSASHISDTLDSVISQTHIDWEHVIVDDGSSDKTFDIAQQYSKADRRFRVFRTSNTGVATTRNTGYRLTDQQSEFVIFLDHDDCWKRDTLERLLSYLRDHPEMPAVNGLAEMVDFKGIPIADTNALEISHRRRMLIKDGDAFAIRLYADEEPTTFAGMICNCAIPTPGALLLRKRAFETIRDAYGYFDPSMGSGNDWDAWIRMTLQAPIGFINDIIISWRQHSNNGTKDTVEISSADQKVRRKIMLLPGLTEAQRAMAEWRYRSIYRY